MGQKFILCYTVQSIRRYVRPVYCFTNNMNSRLFFFFLFWSYCAKAMGRSPEVGGPIVLEAAPFLCTVIHLQPVHLSKGLVARVVTMWL